MARDPLGERWVETYRDTPEVFDRFSRAEDCAGVMVPALLAASGSSGRSVLEIGCGTGRWTRELAASAGTYVALEPAPGMLRLAQRVGAQRTHWLRARGEALPFGSAKFERVLAAFVFANLRPQARVASLAEARRVLRPDGEIWLVENHWDDDFQSLRRAAGLEVTVEVEPLLSDGFELAQSLESTMRFESAQDAREILGHILGPRVETHLASHPQAEFVHRLCLLRGR